MIIFGHQTPADTERALMTLGEARGARMILVFSVSMRKNPAIEN